MIVWRELSPGAAVSALALLLALVAGVRALRPRTTEVHKRGVVLIGERSGRARPARVRPARVRPGRDRPGRAGSPWVGPSVLHPSRLVIASRPVEFSDETKHFKFVGTTGTGKSTAIRELLEGALARGDRAVFADPDGGYCQRFFRRYRGDLILNPFERESVRWDLFAEINDSYDVEELSTGLIPASEDASSNEWRSYARTFLNAVLRHLRRTPKPTLSELWRLLALASTDELRRVTGDTPAQAFLEPDNARMFGSIRSVAVSAVSALEYIQSQRSSSFSVRRWVQQSGEPGAVFITYKAGQIAALRALIATWMRLAIFEAMSGVENRDQRLWFVIDELDALGAIAGLKDALARLRKFGGRCVLGLQSIAQVSGTYGAADAQTIVENCGNTLILRCSGSESGGTSQFASRLIGEREVIRRQTSRGSDRGNGWFSRESRRSKSITDQHVTELAVMASQIEQLPDLCGYLKLASSPAWRRVTLNGQS